MPTIRGRKSNGMHLKFEKGRNRTSAQDLKQKVIQYCDDLFHSIGLQTSVPKYDARGYERGVYSILLIIHSTTVGGSKMNLRKLLK